MSLTPEQVKEIRSVAAGEGAVWLGAWENEIMALCDEWEAQRATIRRLIEREASGSNLRAVDLSAAASPILPDQTASVDPESAGT